MTTEFNNLHCDSDLANLTSDVAVDYYGLCKPRYFPARKRGENGELVRYYSLIVLPNVNTTFTSPQNISVNLNYPNFNTYVRSGACYSADNCTFDGVNATYWTTQTDLSCQPQHSNSIYNISYDGTCYRQEEYFYNSFQCIDEHTSATNYYVGDGCQHLYRTEIYRRVCSSTSTTIDHCTAPPFVPAIINNPSNNPSATSPSSASIIGPSALIALSIIALLF